MFSLPSLNEFSPGLDIFQGLKISLQLQRLRMSIRRKSAITQQWSFNFRSQSAEEDAQESLVAFSVSKDGLPPALAANLELNHFSSVQHSHRRDRTRTNKTDLVFFLAFDNPNVSSKLF